MENWISPKEAAELTGYHQNYVRDLAYKKKIVSKKFGGFTLMIDKESLLEYKEKMDEKREERSK